MITACFARRRQRCTDRVELGFLFMLQEVSPIGKTRNQINYHPQSGWFEDTPLKGGTEEGCPLKGVHEGTCLLRLDSVRGTTLALLASHRGIVCRLSVARRIALGAFVWCGKRDSPTRHPLLPLNAGTAEPFRVSPPEAVAYHLESPKAGQLRLS